MIADEDIVYRERGRKSLMNSLDGIAGLRAARDVGLVGDDKESEAVHLQVDQ
jgi:hypothetical protein